MVSIRPDDAGGGGHSNFSFVPHCLSFLLFQNRLPFFSSDWITQPQNPSNLSYQANPIRIFRHKSFHIVYCPYRIILFVNHLPFSCVTGSHQPQSPSNLSYQANLTRIFRRKPYDILFCSIMAAVALLPSKRQSLEHRHFSTATRMSNVAVLGNTGQATIAALQAAAPQYNLPANFLPPAYFEAGTVPNSGDLNADYVNGFGFLPYPYLIQKDGNAAQPVPEGCICGNWVFHAYGCGHVYRLLEHVVCGATKQFEYSLSRRCCYRQAKTQHVAKMEVLGPCAEVGCSWWADRSDDIDALGGQLQGHDPNLVRRWPARP